MLSSFPSVSLLLGFVCYLNSLAVQSAPDRRPSTDGVYDLEHDFVPDTPNRRRRRYVLSKRKWRHDLLTWKLEPDNLNEADKFIIRNSLHRAFANWAAVSSLKFFEIQAEDVPSDISIAFVRGKHGDNLPFDGREGIVAHAFYPTIGLVHFDADEEWTLNRSNGINLYQTAVHEIGHLLGLEHSMDRRAVMFPRNRQYDRHYGLSSDDIRAIERLYPPPRKLQQPPSPPVPSKSVN